MMRFKKVAALGFPVLMLLLTATLVVLPGTPVTLAFTTKTSSGSTSTGKWIDRRSVDYAVSPSVDSLVAGAKNMIINNTMVQWSNASRLAWSYNASYTTGGSMYITTADYTTATSLGSCGVPADTNISGANCVGAHTYYNSGEHNWVVTKSELFLNSTSKIKWINSGRIISNPSPSSTNPNTRSILNTSLHEVSHSYILDHDSNHQEAASWAHTATDSQVEVLQHDDTHAATIMYGVRTNWEDGFARGEVDTIAFWNGKIGSYDTNIYGFPILARSQTEQPRSDREVVVPKDGAWMERFAGCSEREYAYAYMRLFSSANDSTVEHSVQERPYLKIRDGMRLKWFQYNYQQRNMSVDFKMIDQSGNVSYLRDKGLTATITYETASGPVVGTVPVHPGGRLNSPTKVWFINDVDLSSLRDNKIIEWYIAYDNGGQVFDPARECPFFRGYFDNLRIEYPSSWRLDPGTSADW